MKLQTDIKPRHDGTVKAHMDGLDYTFVSDESGVPSCDIQDRRAIFALLATGNFFPANPEDVEIAAAAAAAAQGDLDDLGDELSDGQDGGPDDGADDALDDEQEPALDAMPIEANSPLRPAPNVRAGGRPRKAK